MTWTLSKLTRRLGEEINNEESASCWGHENDTPTFCPVRLMGALVKCCVSLVVNSLA